MSTPNAPVVTISHALAEFLADQETRVGPKTLSKYAGIIGLFKSYLESYWPCRDASTKASRRAAAPTATRWAGRRHLGIQRVSRLFHARKVICGKETLRAAGTVTRTLAKWLTEKGYATRPSGQRPALEAN